MSLLATLLDAVRPAVEVGLPFGVAQRAASLARASINSGENCCDVAVHSAGYGFKVVDREFANFVGHGHSPLPLGEDHSSTRVDRDTGCRDRRM